MNVSKYDTVLPFSFEICHGQCPVLKIKQNGLTINENLENFGKDISLFKLISKGIRKELEKKQCSISTFKGTVFLNRLTLSYSSEMNRVLYPQRILCS